MTDKTLHLKLPAGIYNALKEHCARTGEPPEHAAISALAEFLDIEHHTIYQVSTSGALVQGVFQGCVKIGDVKRHGDFGLGSFDSLDGEGVLLDGIAYQARSDGSVSVVADDTLAPFWVAAHFSADTKTTFKGIGKLEQLTNQIDALRPSGNLFSAIRIRGHFKRIKYRVACKAQAGETLLDVASKQAEFTFEDISGTLVGFWTPTYAKTLNVPGYHLHFISDDRTRAGHVLDLYSEELEVELHLETNLQLVLPETRSFLTADLSGDPSHALATAEGEQPSK